MAASEPNQRVFIYLQKPALALKGDTESTDTHTDSDTAPVQATFTECIIKELNDGKDGDSSTVYVKQNPTDGHIVLSKNPFFEGDRPTTIKCPSFCPINLMTEEYKRDLPAEIARMGCIAAAVAIVESGDGKVLLIRRAKHLRTFPGVWVPPGGHIEVNETAEQAARRELMEETGLDLHNEMIQKEQILTAWESAFPPMLSAGQPKRHHVIIYVYFKLKPVHSSIELFENLTPNPEETEATAWLDRDLIMNIVSMEEGTDRVVQGHNLKLKPTFRALMSPHDGSTRVEDLPTGVLLNRAPEGQADIERVSTGTKHALFVWLNI